MSAVPRPPADRPTICLSMIVRDEARVVRETLDSIAPHIDHWVVVDTGSRDDTIEVVRGHMREKGIPGELHERPWRDFGTNRTEALELCRGRADYAWVVDADDLVHGDLDLSRLVADSYLLRYGDDFRYWRKQVFRDGLRWRFEGTVHEYPTCSDPATEARLEGDYHLESRRLGARNRDPAKYRRDCRLLEAELDRDPGNERAAFYLAQSHFDAGDHRAALDWYTRRAAMGGWNEELAYSHLRRGECLRLLDEPWSEALEAYLEAWQARPTRAEPLYEIARHYRLADQFELGHMFARRACEIPFPEGDTLFVAADVYRWRARDERAVSAFYSDRREESFGLCTELLEERSLPDAERERVEANRDTCIPALAEARAGYPASLVREITARVGTTSDPPEVTLTITSCRRPALFERTVNSFLACCTDLDRIGRWICVDNGSSETDRARIRELYPFFELIETDPGRGERHPHSLNRALEEVDSPWWLHLEDDWQFFWRGPYVGRALAILDDDERISQVAFNRNYGESVECRRIVGGTVRFTGRDCIRYRAHDFIDPGTAEWRRYLDSLPAGALTVAYWPHFTLRPSLARTEAVKALGRFDPESGHFERDFARRYAAAGHITAFFDQINALHTGRRTWEGPDAGSLSAYDLVGDGVHPARPAWLETESTIPEGVELAVINLDRRPDRWEAFEQMATRAAGPGFMRSCRRVDAVDGSELQSSDELRHLFRGNDFGFRRGIVGCALSHIRAWRSVAEADGDDAELCLVLEDDVELGERFDRRLAEVCAELRAEHPDFDLALLLDYYARSEEAEAEPEGEDGLPRLAPVRWERYLGGLSAYLISRKGARRLLSLVERDGVQNGIDTFLRVKADELEAVECRPPIATAPLALAGNDVDSDIQHDFAPVRDQAAGQGGTARADGIPTVAQLAPSFALAELRLDVEPGRRCSAMKIAAENEGFRALVRTDPAAGAHDTAPLDYVVELDDELRVTGVRELTASDDDGAGEPPEDVDGPVPTKGGVALPEGELHLARADADTKAPGAGHRFVLLDERGRVAASSVPFRFAEVEVERHSGIAERDGELVISLVGAGRGLIATLELDEALALLDA